MTFARSIALTAGIVCALVSSDARHAAALDKVRAAKALSAQWFYTPLDIGVAQGIFARYGLDIELSDMAGSARLQQALVAGSLDFGLGPANDMAFHAKGATDIAVAAFTAGDWPEMSLNVAIDSPIRSAADLKDKVLGGSSNGSLPEWVGKRISIAQGWGPDGIRFVASGGFQATVAAMFNHSIDGFLGATEAGLLLAEQGRGRVIDVTRGLPPFLHTVVYAREALIAENPALVKRFLNGLFATIAYVRTHKAETTAIAARALGSTPTVMDKTYDLEIQELSPDGRFDPAEIKRLKDFFVETGVMAEPAEDRQLFTTQFVPVAP